MGFVKHVDHRIAGGSAPCNPVFLAEVLVCQNDGLYNTVFCFQVSSEWSLEIFEFWELKWGRGRCAGS